MSGSSEAKHGLSLQTSCVTYNRAVYGRGGGGPGEAGPIPSRASVASGAAPVYCE